jgi:hypothetical protein
VGCGGGGADKNMSDGGPNGSDGGPTVDGSPPPNDCSDRTSATVATLIEINVTWDGSIGVVAGSGTIRSWILSQLTFNGTDVTADVRACGNIVPALTLTALAGGGQLLPEFPDATWDAPSMPVFSATGATSGFTVGSTVTMDASTTLLGLTMNDPLNDPWPADDLDIVSVDHDGDGKPGITAIPRSDDPYVLPPPGLFSNAEIDALYLATRVTMSLSGTRDTCSTATGVAIVQHLDTHVVGCHIKGGSDCSASQTDFVDDNNEPFLVDTATFTMIELSSTATCAGARAALPSP